MGEPKKPARVKVADDPIRHAACQAVQLFSRCLRLVGVRVRHGRHAVTLVATLCPATTLARTAVVARQREVALFGQDAQQADLPLDGHLLGRPEVLHEVLHEREAGVG